MQRILEPGEIEAFGQRSLPRLRLPDRAHVFSRRAARLRRQSEAAGHAIGDYLRLMAHLADAQQVALAAPSIDAHQALVSICDSLSSLPDLPTPVREVCDRLRLLQPEQIEEHANALLGQQPSAVDAAAAPFLMAALQVYWVDIASRTQIDEASDFDAPGLCPVCGALPVASVVRSQGLRYLHCSLCATEWHLVRVKCSHCQSTQGITYQSIENGPPGIRAECCDACRLYRKILYQEQDGEVEPVADDLASLPLDLLLSEAGYRRASANPLLWNS